MKTDIVKIDEKWCVFSRDAFDGYEYKGDPLFGPCEYEGECEGWCDAYGYPYRRRRCASLVPPKFLRDVEARADKYMELIRGKGLVVESNITYRASAAWKEQPTHYAYSGDFGGRAKLTWEEGSNVNAEKWDYGLGVLRELFGMADALWELGFTLTFDKDGKHTVYGNFAEWVMLDRQD